MHKSENPMMDIPDAQCHNKVISELVLFRPIIMFSACDHQSLMLSNLAKFTESKKQSEDSTGGDHDDDPPPANGSQAFQIC